MFVDALRVVVIVMVIAHHARGGCWRSWPPRATRPTSCICVLALQAGIEGIELPSLVKILVVALLGTVLALGGVPLGQSAWSAGPWSAPRSRRSLWFLHHSDPAARGSQVPVW